MMDNIISHIRIIKLILSSITVYTVLHFFFNNNHFLCFSYTFNDLGPRSQEQYTYGVL